MSREHQESLFDVEIAALEMVERASVIEPRHRAVAPEARPRLSRQNRAVLLMLRGGPKTNAELATVALHYNARIWDLRGAGCAIDCDHDPASGRAVYTLRHEPEGLT